MSWQYSPYTLPLLFSAAVSAALSVYAWTQRSKPGARAFTLMMLALTQWSLAAALQHAGADVLTQYFWNRLQYFGIVAAVTAWFCLCLQYTSRGHWLTRPRLLLLALPPLAVAALAWINPRELFAARVHGLTLAGVSFLHVENGPLFWVHTAYAYLLLVAGAFLLLLGMSRAPLVYRGQVRSLLTAAVIPAIVNLAGLLGIRLFPFLDLTPFAFGISGLAFAWGLFRFGLLDLVPVAREAVMEGMADAVVVLDARSRIADLNPAARTLLGDVGGLVARDAFSGWPGVGAWLDAAEGRPIEVDVGAGEAGRSFELRQTALAERPGGARGGRLLELHDVTERKRAEKALRRQNAYLSALLESSRVINSGLDLPTVLQNIAGESARLVSGDPGGIGLMRDGQLVFEYLWRDGRWEKTDFAFPLGEGIAGRVASTGRALIVNDPRSDPRVSRPDLLEMYDVHGFLNVPILDRGGHVVGVLDVRRRRDGPAFSDADRLLLESLARQAAIAIENAALYRDLEEKKARVAESLRTVEQLYKHEQQVSRHLQELHLMRTNFMIVTSHEMRTPLTLLRGYVEALQQGFLGAPSQAQASALGYCRRTVERMIASFNDILEMLQLGQQSVALARQPVSLEAVARGVLEELAPFVERRGQRVSLEAAEDLPLVSADPEKLRLVLLNLIENAIKFTPDAGSIRVRVAADAESLRLDVEDDGIGIEPEELPRVFEQFYTSPDPRHHHSGSFEFEARGAGLGLAIAKGYVEAHGGRIWAESPGRGRGSRFHVLLPIAAEQQAKTA